MIIHPMKNEPFFLFHTCSFRQSLQRLTSVNSRIWRLRVQHFEPHVLIPPAHVAGAYLGV